MSHSRDHIIQNIIVIIDEPEVRDHWTSDQCTKVDQIKAAAPAWTDEQFRYVQRRIAQAFCSED